MGRDGVNQNATFTSGHSYYATGVNREAAHLGQTPQSPGALNQGFSDYPAYGYDTGSSYSAAPGYGPAQGYNAAPGYGPAQGYDAAPGYGPAQGYGGAPEYSPVPPYGAGASDPGVLNAQPAGTQYEFAPAGTTRAARERVAVINAEAKNKLGHWGRNAGKYVNWTLVGLPVGILAHKASGKRLTQHLAQQRAELDSIRDAVLRIPKKQRSAAQKELLKKTDTALRKFQPSARTHIMETLKGGAIVTTAAAILAIEIGVLFATAALESPTPPGIIFMGVYGGGWGGGPIIPVANSNLSVRRPKAKNGDDAPLPLT